MGEKDIVDDELAHIELVLQLLNVMDKDHRFQAAINERKEAKEVRTMSEWLTKVINDNQAIGRAEGEARGIAKGIAKGRAEGRIATLSDLVRKNLISVKDASEQAGMSEVEFCREAGLPVQQ